MIPPADPDCDTLTVTKGPEDGVCFRLTQTPFFIGRGADCAVGLALDLTVQHHHARVSASRRAYRIRSATGAPVYVDGKRAGHLRSRKLRPGGILKVGYTELILKCAPGGLASSRRWPIHESDLAWVLRYLLVGAGRAAGLLFRPIRVLGVFVWENWLVLVIVGAVAALVFVPAFRERVLDLFYSVWYRLNGSS